MFRSARIKLTIWYAFIIMSITIAFSVGIYTVLLSEVDRMVQIQRVEIEKYGLRGMLHDSYTMYVLDPSLIIETKRRIAMSLMMIDGLILAVTTVAGYFLAGRTLRPIQAMVDEQYRFVTDASHELRTPLTALRSEIEVNLRDKKLTLAEAKRLLSSNLEEVHNLQSLSDELIKLTRYHEEANRNLPFAEISLSAVIEEAIKKVIRQAEEKQIALVNKLNDSDITIEGNKQTLVELFVIFMDNAIKYSLPKSSVTLSFERLESQIIIHISDTGIGISKDDIPHLFDRFYRADKSRLKPDSAGYGLGLSIAKQIVSQHHGLIKVQSELNKGTTFTLQFPIKQPHKLM